MNRPSWAVVATVDEPAPLIIAFVAHTLSLGPKALHLFLDRPNPEAEAALRGLPNLHLVVCDAGHWANLRDGGFIMADDDDETTHPQCARAIQYFSSLIDQAGERMDRVRIFQRPSKSC